MYGEIVRIFIIDISVGWRETMSTLIDRQSDMDVVGSSPNLSSAFNGVLKLKPDIVLIDHLPSSEHEHALLGYLDHTTPHICFVLHSCCPEGLSVAVQKGACKIKYLPRGSSLATILRVIREASKEYLVLSAKVDKQAN